ncbi:hypothetical protein [Leptothoe sp. PORK10 BA2]|uniref:hypothetical protein n=1 Tax=Leptothoe sp. PORK10 BA2 TaxID=3110254 RepID=UPI002B21FA09|nr:hypothetical protein [Leptothoe sp. PORK10 BA2]MEA5464020.1 hypothetical protein [Leptothoe sp. PORK10 BA2]
MVNQRARRGGIGEPSTDLVLSRKRLSLTLSHTLRSTLGHVFGLTLGTTLSLSLGYAPSLAQLPPLPPQLPPAPPAPPAIPSIPESPVTPDPAPSLPENSSTSDGAPTFIRPQTACTEDFNTLSTLLLRDIPSYTNRILQSSVADIPTGYRPAYVITASQPEKVPLDITDRVYTTDPEVGQPLKQLFFTTLERQYSGLNASSISHFHWLFLAPSEDGWEMVFMFSAIEAENGAQIPPRDSSQGSVGQAVQRWLVDCRANAIFPE